MLEREVPRFGTRKSTVVRGCSTNLLRKAANATTTWGTSVTCATIVAMQQQGPSTQRIHKEPKIGLPVKFDGTRSQFRGFLNQVRLVIQMHPS